LDSSKGGFLLGFGLCLLTVSIGLLIISAPVTNQIGELRGQIEEVYTITHSTTYETIKESLEFVTPSVDVIADALALVPGLIQYAHPLRQLTDAASIMNQVKESSEISYAVFSYVEAVTPLCITGIVIGGLATVVGSATIIQAKKKAN
jgi:hypothetical protein